MDELETEQRIEKLIQQAAEFNWREEHYNALPCYDEAIDLNPDRWDLYLLRGVMWLTEDLFDAELEKLKFSPDSPNLSSEPSGGFSESHFDLALEDISHAIELNPAEPLLYYFCATIFLEQGKYKEALFNLNKAIKLNPNFSLAHERRQKVFKELIKATLKKLHGIQPGDTPLDVEAIEFAQEPEIKLLKDETMREVGEYAQEKEIKLLKAEAASGMEEYGAEQWHERQAIINALGAVMDKRGFTPLETSAIEYGTMITGYISTDEIFILDGKKVEDLILRYDLTAPLARYVATHFDALPKPFRRYQVGSVFRNDKPDGGRFRQFTQMDADTIGSTHPAADAEMIMMLCESLEAAGLQQGEYTIRVNHRMILDKVFDFIVDQFGRLPLERRRLMRILDKYDRLGEKGLRALLGEGRADASGDSTKGANLNSKQSDEIIAFLQLSHNKSRKAFLTEINQRYGRNQGSYELAEMDNLFSALGFDESRIQFDSSIVRGLAYYTGVVFEADVGSKIGSVGGGGRYNNLLRRFRKEPVPAVGMSVGISRLHFFLNQKKKPAQKRNLIVILAMETERMAHYQQLATDLRAAGLTAEVYIGEGNMRKQLKYADKRKARLALIEGEDERKEEKITIKDLQLGEKLADEIAERDAWREGAHAQQTIPHSALVETCRQLIKQ